MKQSLQGKHGIPRPGSHLRAESAEEAANHTMYRQRTFLGGDPRLGAPHSPGFTGTTVKRKGCCQGTRLSTSPDTREKGKTKQKTPKNVSDPSALCVCSNETTKAPKSSLGVFLCDPHSEDCTCEERVSHFSYNRRLTSQSVSAPSRSLTHTRTDTKVISTLLNSSPDTDDMEVLMYQKF